MERNMIEPKLEPNSIVSVVKEAIRIFTIESS